MNRKRVLDRAESTFWLFDRASSMNFAVYADGRGLLDRDLLVQGLEEIRNRMPVLQASIGHDQANAELFFQDATDQPVALREHALESFESSQYNQIVGDAIMEPFAVDESPLCRCGLLQGPDRFRLFLVFHHSIADGRSGLDLLRRLFSFLAGQDLPDSSAEFPGGMHSLLESESGLAPELEGSPELESHPAQPVSFFEKRSATVRTNLDEIKLNSGETVQLKENCKSHNATMHGVLGAALLNATLDLHRRYQNEGDTGSMTGPDGPDNALHRLALASPADMRKGLRSGQSDLALYISLITSTMDVKAGDVWGLARALSEDVHRQLKESALDFYRLLPDPARYLKKPDPGKAYAAFLQRLPQAVALSNAGPVEAFPGPSNDSWKVDHVAFSVHPSLSQIAFVAATTYEGLLTLTIHMDAARWPESGPAEFKDRIRHWLQWASSP